MSVRRETTGVGALEYIKWGLSWTAKVIPVLYWSL